MEGVSMSGMITDLTAVATAVLSQVSAVTTTIVGDPLLLFTTGILFLGGAVGIMGRILSRN